MPLNHPDVDYSKLPERLRDGARRWIEERIKPGDFLTAVIKNDLLWAFTYADDENLKKMHEIVKWWYNEAPHQCWGSPERFNSWKDQKEPT